MEASVTNYNQHNHTKDHARIDRIGIIASILCAIHCALTPILLIALPTFGKAWAHPATHWGMALVVVPIAIFMMRKGYQKHGKKWTLLVGSIGIYFIILGSILPYLEQSNSTNSAPLTPDLITQSEHAAVG